ncbi:AhpC/TSA family protein, partial [Leclercia adecarboxylata]|nr:AhpC/TSA family protein [Leclercia adecarboxylata]
DVRTVYDGFNLNIPEKNGAPGEWALPLSATYVIAPDGEILFADLGVDYRHRVDPLQVLAVLEQRAAAE